MDDKKFEIRFMLKKSIYEKLKDKAEQLDVPLASYVKSNVERWAKNVKL